MTSRERATAEQHDKRAAAERHDKRAAAERHGRRAEWLSVWLLRLKGYRILARHWRSPVGEIDIIARRGRVLAFVEVKARREVDVAAEALTPRQQRRIVRAARHFIAGWPALGLLDQRFDLILVVPRRLPIHVPAAWSEPC
jgi:putative endonuclease